MELYIGVIIGFVILLLLLYAFINYRRVGNEYVHGIGADGIEPIIKQLDSKKEPDKAMLNRLAENVATRQNLFHVLKSYHRLDLYPDAHYSIEHGAASNLVNWVALEENLAYPPTMIEIVQSVIFEKNGKEETFYVYKFKIDPPHFAAEHGWLLGVVGPFTANDKPFDWPKIIISRFKSAKASNAKKEAKWARQQLYGKS